MSRMPTMRVVGDGGGGGVDAPRTHASDCECEGNVTVYLYRAVTSSHANRGGMCFVCLLVGCDEAMRPDEARRDAKRAIAIVLGSIFFLSRRRVPSSRGRVVALFHQVFQRPHICRLVGLRMLA